MTDCFSFRCRVQGWFIDSSDSTRGANHCRRRRQSVSDIWPSGIEIWRFLFLSLTLSRFRGMNHRFLGASMSHDSGLLIWQTLHGGDHLLWVWVFDFLDKRVTSRQTTTILTCLNWRLSGKACWSIHGDSNLRTVILYALEQSQQPDFLGFEWHLQPTLMTDVC